MEQLEARNALGALLASLVGKQVTLLTDIDAPPDRPQIHAHGILQWREDSFEYSVRSAGVSNITFTASAVLHIFLVMPDDSRIILRG